ncbi:MAG TPA: S9 family peptidase [Armatimonadota bacterium]|jgi:dipeptidyl aminopeptidase/acylaminoacyl peptidase
MPPTLIPRETLFGNPTFTRPGLSPDGRWLAYIAPLDGVLNVWLRAAEGGDAEPLTNDTGRGIRAYAWTYDREHVLYVQDRDGDENWHVYAVRITDRAVRDLTPADGVQAHLVAVERNTPDRILVALNQRDPALHDVYEVTLSTGESQVALENPGDALAFVADASLQVRCVAAQTADGGWDIRLRGPEDGEWKSVHTVGPEDEAGPLSFSEDGAGLYIVTSKDANAKQVALLDAASGSLRVLAGREDVDCGDVVFHPVSRELQAVSFDRHRTEWEVLDESLRADLEALKAVNDGDLGIGSRTDDDSRWIVEYTRDIGSVGYYLYHRTEKRAEFLFSARPELDRYTLAPMSAVDIRSRDGLTLPSYLTLPVGSNGKNLPMVLNVHGGPWARDQWGYDPEAQWFANRGYACLQVNFRSSEGFGKAFTHAGDREWGRKMLDDLIDAVDWAVERGIADPARVAIFGGSYGGYAVLCGLAFQPRVFCCGVDIVGPSNLLTFLNSIPPYWEVMRKMLDDRVGRAVEDEDMLKERSPLFHVENIVKPLLIAQGANDPRVPQAESDQIVAAMESSGKPVEYMVFEDEGHGFARPENRLKFYAAAEAFLAKYLGGRSE